MAAAAGRQVMAAARGLLKPVSLLVAAFLATTMNAAPPDNSKLNWTMDCAMCHGAKGKGNTGMGRYLGAPNYQDPKVQASFTDEQAFKAIKEGKQVDGRMKMKPFASELTDLDIRELVAYLRAFNKGK